MNQPLRKLITMVLMVFAVVSLFANVLLTEDFEIGSFGNNWTVVNGTQVNQWFVGSATANNSQYSAYISNNSGTDNAYTVTTTSVVHFYRDVTFPANITGLNLQFDWKCNGEGTSTLYDYIKVYVIDTNVTPVDGTLLTPTPLATYNLNQSWNHAEVNIPSAYVGQTKRIVFTWRNDSSDGTQPPAAIDNISINYMEVSQPPVATTPLLPALNAVNVAINPTLTWNEAAGATGYKVYVGTDNPPTNIANAVSQTTASFSINNLNYNTNIFWKVVPFNVNGEAVDCPIWTFTTRLDPIVIPPYSQNFNNEVFPPIDWVRYSGLLSENSELTLSTSGWVKDEYLNVSSSVNKAARINIYGTSCKYWLVSPPIDLGTTDKQVEFDLAFTDYDNGNVPETVGSDDRFAVLVSTDNGTTWSSNNTLRVWDSVGPNLLSSIPIDGAHQIISLENYSGRILLALYGESTVSNGDNDLFVDNLQIRDIPANPIFVITPTEMNFGSTAINSTSLQNFTISNNGGGSLTIQSIEISGANSADFILSNNQTLPVSISSSETMTFAVNYHPVSVGEKQAIVTIIDNTSRVSHTVALTANCYDATVTSLPYGDNFNGETFPLLGWSNVRTMGTGNPGIWETVTVGEYPTCQPFEGTGMLKYKAFSFAVGTRGILATPIVDFPQGNFSVNFSMYRDSSYVTNRDRVRIFVGTSIDTLSATLIGTINRQKAFEPIVQNDGWYQYSFDLPQSVASTNQYVFLEAISEYGNNIYIDNFSIDAEVNSFPAPQNLVAIAENGSVILNWVAPARSLSNYKVFRNDAEIANLSENTLTYTDTQVTNGTTYSYYVKAIYTNPNGESVASNTVEATPVTVNLYPPLNLTAAVNDNDVSLAWEAAGPQLITLNHASEFASSIGENGPAQFTCAQRFTPAQLSEIGAIGGQLLNVSFIARVPSATYTVKVWTGGSANPLNPGNLVAQKAFAGTIIADEISTVTLDTPITIPENAELWIGYDVDTPTGYPAGCDAGPAVEGFGNLMFSDNEWTTTLTLSATLDLNWSIYGKVLPLNGTVVTLNYKSNEMMKELNTNSHSKMNKTINNSKFSAIRINKTKRTNRSLSGYKVFRGTTLLTETPLSPATLTYTDNDVAYGQYTYNVVAVYTEGESVPVSVEVNVVELGNEIMNDNFESYNNFALECQPWILIDGDQAETYGIENISFENSGSPMAYIVFNPSATTPAITSLTPHSGSKMMASFAASTPPNNDWMITPAIQITAGVTPRVKFWVKSHTNQYGLERFVVTVGNSSNPAQMTPISQGNYIEAPLSWTEFEYDLSSYIGQTVHVGIHCVSNNAFIFYVDDFRVYGNGSIVSNEDQIPTINSTKLLGNYPNPFNPETQIKFSLKEKAHVSLDIYNIKGQKVRTLVNSIVESGEKTVLWNGKDDNNHKVGSGVFFYRMTSGKYQSTGKMILMK